MKNFKIILPHEYDFNWDRPILDMIDECAYSKKLQNNIFKPVNVLFSEQRWPIGKPFEFFGTIPLRKLFDDKGYFEATKKIIYLRACQHESLQIEFKKTFEVLTGRESVDFNNLDIEIPELGTDLSTWEPDPTWPEKLGVDPRLLNEDGYISVKAPEAHLNQTQVELGDEIIEKQDDIVDLYYEKSDVEADDCFRKWLSIFPPGQITIS